MSEIIELLNKALTSCGDVPIDQATAPVIIIATAIKP